jgi:chromosome segregation ATPase
MAPDPELELAQLQERVRAAVSERQDIERQLANPDALRSATARAHRDRDAVTSPLLEEARDKITADIADFLKEWRHVEKVARTAERLLPVIESAPEVVREHHAAIDAALPAVRRRRAQIAETMRSAGLASILPDDDAVSESF